MRSLSVQITVELKNDLAISGELHSVDQYLNVKLNNVRVLNENKYPHMVSLAWTPSLLQASEIVLLAKILVAITANSSCQHYLPENVQSHLREVIPSDLSQLYSSQSGRAA